MNKRKVNDENGSMFGKFNLLEKLIKLLAKYGYKKVISALIIFIVFSGVVVIVSNQRVIVDKILREHKKELQIEEANKLKFRIDQVNPRVDAALYKLLAETKADRAFVIEMHNGTDNPSGLPFVFGDMTYEKLGNDSIESTLYDYEKINLAMYPISTYLIKNKRFMGTVEDLSKIDPRLAKKITSGDAKYIAIYGIRGIDVEIGWLGVTYCSGIPNDKNRLESSLLDCSQGLSILLDMSNNIKISE